ncbi:hypothetical protein JZ751_013932 [Albula glossodonta]|uniref:CARD domain-containing protein n=1 Tax=Albula glossodonta TaxID=121402 RepID=A0A8T2MR91_9TELE|nr:hypothetical protein JZ751_013932 [Albula glossodonta]
MLGTECCKERVDNVLCVSHSFLISLVLPCSALSVVQKDLYPQLAWSLRLRVLYEIALGVNFLHNMIMFMRRAYITGVQVPDQSDALYQNPIPGLVLCRSFQNRINWNHLCRNFFLSDQLPTTASSCTQLPPASPNDPHPLLLLHPSPAPYDPVSEECPRNLHLDRIADFGLSKWRQLSISKASGSKPPEMGGTVIYMPPEEYEPSKTRRADVKHDVYRPDTGPDSLPSSIPCRETLIHLMTRGWAANPDERPSFLQCLIELEPMMRRFDEIEVLEAVLEVKRAKLLGRSITVAPASQVKREEKTLNTMTDSSAPWPDTSSASGSCSSQETDMSQPHFLTISSNVPSKEGHRCSPDPFSKQPESLSKSCSNRTDPSFVTNPLDPPKSLVDPEFESFEDNLEGYGKGTARPNPGLNIPVKETSLPEESMCETRLSYLTLQPRPPGIAPTFDPPSSSSSAGPAAQWIQARREDVVRQMTEACLNQSLDALLARDLLMREDYELVSNQPTRTAKVRKLLDTCDRQSEGFCRVIIIKLQENKQMGLQPYPEFSSPSPTPSAPHVASYINNRNVF